MSQRQQIRDLLEFTLVDCPGGITVQLVQTTPESYPQGQISEHIIAQAARTSFDKFDLEKTPYDDTRLIKRLYKDRHTSPFEMAGVTFQIRAPKFVTIQLLRHRTFSINEESQRYHQVTEGYFHPSSDPGKLIRVPDTANRQSSVQSVVKSELMAKVLEAEEALDHIFELYNELIDLGMARECARFVLPMSTWSTIVIQTDLHNLLHFLRLRLDKAAQFEIQVVARAIFHLVKQIFPVTMGAFEETLTEKHSVDDSDLVKMVPAKITADLIQVPGEKVISVSGLGMADPMTGEYVKC